MAMLSRSAEDLTSPSVARVYDYLLGGAANWVVDREFAERALERFPLLRDLAVMNRRWLSRVVNAALDQGITQFVDVGAGSPAPGVVHEIVARRTDQGRVVYVDNDPVAHAHMELALGKVPGLWRWVTALCEDLRDPEAILDDPETRELIDFTHPVCVLMGAVLHFLDRDSDVLALIGRYRDAVAPGSWIAISHLANDAVPDATAAAAMAELVASSKETQTPAYLRDRAEIASWFTSWGELFAPGLVHLPEWRPQGPDLDSAAARPFSWCGVAATPGEYR